MFLNLLLDANTPIQRWITASFPIIQTVLIILIAVFAIVVIISVIAQPSKPAGGNNVITGTNTDSYFAKHKSHTKEGRLNKLIIISSISIFVLTVLYFVSFAIYSGI